MARPMRARTLVRPMRARTWRGFGLVRPLDALTMLLLVARCMVCVAWFYVAVEDSSCLCIERVAFQKFLGSVEEIKKKHTERTRTVRLNL